MICSFRSLRAWCKTMPKGKPKIDLDWMDDISDGDLPTMMSLDKGWHRFDVDLSIPPEVTEIEIPSKPAPKLVPQLEVWARYYDLDDNDWNTQYIPFWGMKAFKVIVKQMLDDEQERRTDGAIYLDLEVRVLMPTENKRTAEFRRRD